MSHVMGDMMNTFSQECRIDLKWKKKNYGIHYLRMPKEISLPHEYAKKV